MIPPEIPKELKELKEVTKRSGIQLVSKTLQDLEREELRHVLGSEHGRVLDMGELCYKARFVCKPWCKKGDEVLFIQNAGNIVKDVSGQNRNLRMINDEDILGLLK